MDAGGEKCGDAVAAEGGGDLYAVLGLKKECSDADLKVAYRKLAKKWHPDKCSSSSSVKHMEEAKEKFQEIQGAYSVLSDANKRLLYDVGVYDDEDDEDSMQGMGDFIGEMAQMMRQVRPTRQESFEELQQLFVDMFQSDMDSGFCNGTAKDHQAQGQAKSRTCSTSPSSSPSPPPTIVKEAEVPSCNGFNKRGSSAMDSGIRMKTDGIERRTPQPFSTFTFEYENENESGQTEHENEHELTEYREFRKRNNSSGIISNTVGIRKLNTEYRPVDQVHD